MSDRRTLRSTPESGGRAGYDGAKRRTGSRAHAAADTLGHLLALRVTPADGQGRQQVTRLAAGVRAATGEPAEPAFAGQGSTGEQPAGDAKRAGIELSVVRRPGARRGFVLLPRRRVAERSFAWAARFRRPARDYERLADTPLRGLHFVAFACVMLRSLASRSG